jgi:hypothetical protein
MSANELTRYADGRRSANMNSREPLQLRLLIVCMRLTNPL